MTEAPIIAVVKLVRASATPLSIQDLARMIPAAPLPAVGRAAQTAVRAGQLEFDHADRLRPAALKPAPMARPEATELGRKILDAMDRIGPLTPRQLRRRLADDGAHYSPAATRKMLATLIKQGAVVRSHGAAWTVNSKGVSR